MKLLATLLLSVLSASAQLVNMGGPATGQYQADTFCGGASWGPANDPAMGNQSGIYQTLKYGTYTCDIPVAILIGTCTVKLDLLENRAGVPVGTTPASAVGTRLFTVTVNGVSTGTIDIFAAAGAQTPYSPPPLTVPVSDGHVRATWASAGAGNPVGSGIEVSGCVAPQLGGPCTAPAQLPPAIYAKLSDGSCAPLVIVPPVGFIADTASGVDWVWTSGYPDGSIHVQAMFSVFTPAPTQ